MYHSKHSLCLLVSIVFKLYQLPTYRYLPTYFAALSKASILLHTYLAVAAPVADVAAVAERPRVHGQADSARLARIPQTVVHVRLSYVLRFKSFFPLKMKDF